MMRFILIIFVFYKITAQNIPEGAQCRLRDGTAIGICTKTLECPSVVRQLQSGAIRTNPPTICSTTDRTVCCPNQQQQQQLTSINKSPVTSPRPVRISERSK